MSLMNYNPSVSRLGLCCLTHGPNYRTQFKTVRKGWAESNPEHIRNRLITVWDHNLNELEKVITFCASQAIWCYRISSDMFPLADLHPYSDIWDEYKQPLNSVLCAARRAVDCYIKQGGRLSTHPGQFCVITSSKADVVRRSLLNLELHADFFDVLGIPCSYFFPINIHLSNGKAGASGSLMARAAMKDMSQSLINRLVFETEDKSYWTWQRIIEHFPDIPVTLDYHHRNINNLGESEHESHLACFATWKNTKPLFHYTEGAAHELDRSHADLITCLPRYRDVDMEIEAKHKEQAVLRALEWL